MSAGAGRMLALAVGVLTIWGIVLQTRLAGGTVPGRELFAPLVVGLGAAAGLAVAVGRGRAERFLAGRGVWIAWAIGVALLVGLLLVGRRYRGGLYLPGRINPSELLKLCAVAFTAGWCARGERVFAGMRGFGVFAGAWGIWTGLVAATGDFGLLAQLALTVAGMLFVVSWWWGLLAGLAVAGACVLVAAYPVGHLATRFAVWRDPFADAMGAGWQTLQGLTAVVAGGLDGVGFGLGNVERIPIVSSDFVYAALAEDLGLAGCAVVLALWGCVVGGGLRVASGCAARGNRMEGVFAAGLSLSLLLQVLLNVAGVLNALPMTGITLPLISRGGSSLAVTLAMCGILYGLSRGGVNFGKMARGRNRR